MKQTRLSVVLDASEFANCSNKVRIGLCSPLKGHDEVDLLHRFGCGKSGRRPLPEQYFCTALETVVHNPFPSKYNSSVSCFECKLDLVSLPML